MPYISKTYSVFIASPGDVEEERDVIREVLMNWNYQHSRAKNVVLIPVGWETHSLPIQGDRPQGLINKYILNECDVLIGVLWSRIGTPTGTAISGTTEEIDEFIGSDKPTLLYKSNKEIAPDSLDPRQYAEVKKFVKEKMNHGLLEFYDTIQEFKDKLQSHLNILVNSHPFFKESVHEEVSEVVVESEKLTETAHKIMMEVGKDDRGLLQISYDRDKRIFSSNGKQIVEFDISHPRENAEYEKLKYELEISAGMLDDQYETKDGAGLKINARGFEYYDEYTS